MTLRRNVVTGALLHDIGKLIYRSLSGNDIKRRWRHQEIGALWAKEAGFPDDVVQIIRRHHFLRRNDPKYAELSPEALGDEKLSLVNTIYVVAHADSIAAGMERERVGGDGYFDPECMLSPVFKDVVLTGKEPVREKLVWKPKKATDYNYPKAESEVAAGISGLYRELWQELNGELMQDPAGIAEDTLLLLLQKYTFFVPEHTYVREELPDTSLYHHLKTTAAVAWCTYQYLVANGTCWEREDLRAAIGKEDEQRYLLVGGDLSGIQNFIYTLASKGALKTVRGRSFYLELLIEAIVSRLLAALDLPRACVVYASGGGLYLLAPNTDTAKETISFVQQEVNRWLYRQFGTGLYFSLVAEPITAAGLARGLGETWYRVGQKLSVEKERKWYREIKEDYATFFAPRPAENTCPICHQAGKELVPYPGEEEFLVCPFCAQMVRLGQVLPEVKVFYRLPAGEEVAPRASDLVLEVLGISYLFTREDYSGPAAAYYLVENPWSLLRTAEVPAWNFPTGSYFTCKELDDLVKKGLGAERIGVLRLDVDRLGTIFSRGLPREKISFARLNDLSERFNLYFKYYLPALLAREPQEPLLPVHRNRKMWLNLVYAGGDDLFLLGTWNDALEAAWQIYRDFRHYTGHNPSLTISGGLAVAEEKIPLYKLAELAGEVEQRAKDNGRDSFAFFRFAFKWGEMGGRRVVGEDSTLQEFWSLLLKDIALDEKGNPRLQAYSKGFLHDLGRLAAAYGDGENPEREWIVPRLHYLFSRAMERSRAYEESFYRPLLGAVMNERNLKHYLPAAVAVVDLITRGGGEG